VGLGDSGTGGLYSIKGTGETHWLGLMHFSYTDSAGRVCCQQGKSAYINADSASSSTTDDSTFYAMAATNAGYLPTKNVIVSFRFTGDDSADAASGANMATSSATALTPDPSNTLDDKLAAFDATYVPARFPGCRVVEVYGDYITGFCNAFDQGSPTWVYAFQISTASVIALGPLYKNPGCRWCGAHGTGVTASSKWQSFSTAYMIGNQTGEWHAQLASAIGTSDTSLSVTAARWHPSTAYNNSGAAAGYGIVDSNGNIEVATTPGTSGSGSQPAWNTIPGGTTSDGTIVWTNEGPATNPNEPSNIFPFKDSNGNYWTYLMKVAGATGGGSQYNGDLFRFEDGTNECVRVITVGTSGTWSSVTRAEHGNGLTAVCSTTASSHAVGASLRAICEESQNAQGNSGHYWDFIDDPHLNDTTQTYFVRFLQTNGHGYTRQLSPEGNIWNTFLIDNTHNPFVAADFTGSPSFSILSQLTFAGLTTTSEGVAHQDYTTWDFENASFKDSAVGSLYFVTGAGSGGYGSFSKVGGTTSIYKYALGIVPFNYQLPFMPASGGNMIKDISGPSSVLTDGGSTPQSCVVVVAGECWTGSSVGEMYANLPVVDAGSGNLCNNGTENTGYGGHDWCMMNTSTFGDAINQYGLIPANFLGNYPNSPYWPQYGAGLSRRLVQNLAGGIRLQASHPHTVPDGSGVLYETCMADPNAILSSSTNFTQDSYGCHAFLAHIPSQPAADGIDRTNYQNVSITIGPGSAGATHARVKYGYEENEPTRGTTWPPAIHFYCTQYQGTCYSSNQNLSLNSQQTLQIGVPQRVLFYQVDYLNASNQVVASDPLTTVAVP